MVITDLGLRLSRIRVMELFVINAQSRLSQNANALSPIHGWVSCERITMHLTDVLCFQLLPWWELNANHRGAGMSVIPLPHCIASTCVLTWFLVKCLSKPMFIDHLESDSRRNTQPVQVVKTQFLVVLQIFHVVKDSLSSINQKEWTLN